MPILNTRLPEDKNKKSLLHAVLFPKILYNPSQCKEWLKNHNLIYIHNRETINYYRFRIREQIKGLSFYTIKLNNGVQLVYMH